MLCLIVLGTIKTIHIIIEFRIYTYKNIRAQSYNLYIFNAKLYALEQFFLFLFYIFISSSPLKIIFVSGTLVILFYLNFCKLFIVFYDFIKDFYTDVKI